MKNSILSKEDKDLLYELSLAFGPSGCETEVTSIIKREILPYADSVSEDRLGNLTAVIRSGNENAKKLMLSSHTDEVGFMITEIEDNGILNFACLGGIDESVLLGKKVLTGKNRVRGVISAAPFHLIKKADRLKKPDIDSLYIDIGTESREETESLVSIGDFAVFDSSFFDMGQYKIKGKALDDRIGNFIMIKTLKRLRERINDGKVLQQDVFFSFSVREELGYSGAFAAANSIMPDMAIVLETTAVADIFGVAEHLSVAKLGNGGVISPLDRGTMYPKKCVDFALDTAKKYGIPVQIKKFVSGGNDASHISRSVGGVPTLALSAPTRYLHSPACVADTRDIVYMEELLYRMINSRSITEVMK